MKVSVVVCRDCCCGNLRKHPEFDHDAQLAAIREAMAGRGQVRTSTCLDACEPFDECTSAERVRRGPRAWFGVLRVPAQWEGVMTIVP